MGPARANAAQWLAPSLLAWILIWLAWPGQVLAANAPVTGDPGAGQSPDQFDPRTPPTVHVTIPVHFSTPPDFMLPCDDIALDFDTKRLGKLLLKEDLQALQQARLAYKELKGKILPAREALEQATKAMTSAAHAYYRANSVSLIDSDLSLSNFVYSQYLWYAQLIQLNELESQRIAAIRTYFDKSGPLFGLNDMAKQKQVLEEVATRTDCLASERHKAFLAFSKAERAAAAEVSSQGKQSGSWGQRKTSSFASKVANISSLTLRYYLLVSELTTQVNQYGSFARSHALALENRELHDANSALQKKLGMALGPMDPYPEDPGARATRAAVSNARARSALSYLYLQDALGEMGYFKQLNVASGVLGIPALYDAGENLFKDVASSGDILTQDQWNAKWAHDASALVLSVVAAGVKFLGSSFGTIATGPAQDLVIQGAKPAAQFVGWDLKTSAEFALEKYEEKSKESARRAKLLQRMVERHADAAGFEHGKKLIAVVSGERPGGTVADQAPDTFSGLLEDNAFVSGSGGGIAWILEPFAESPAEQTRLALWGARHELTGSARAAWLRIAADRGISVANPDQPLTALTRSEPSNAQLGLRDDPWAVEELSVRYGTWLASGAGRSQALAGLTGGMSNIFSYEAKNRPSQDQFLDDLVMAQALYDAVLDALKAVDYDYRRLSAQDWNAFQKHIRLLGLNAEYLSGYMRVRTALRDRVKMFIYAAYLDENGKLENTGKVRLGHIDQAQEAELSDLAARTAWLKLSYHALSINYVAAAATIKNLQIAENKRRAIFHDGQPVDLKSHAAAFRREARLSQVTAAYQDLLADIVKDLAIGFAIKKITAVSAGDAARRYRADKLGDETLSTAGFAKHTLQQLNPWVGKFGDNGLWEMAKGGANDAAVSALAQLGTKMTNLWTYEQWNSGLGLLAKFRNDLNQEYGAIAANEAQRQQVLQRMNRLVAAESDIAASTNRDTDTLARLDDAITSGDRTEIALAREEVLQQAQEAASNQQRLKYRLLKAGLVRAMEQDLANRETERQAQNSGPIGEIIKAGALKRAQRSGSSADSEEVESAARVVIGTEFHQLMTDEAPTSKDLARLLDPDDPAGLKQHILTEGMDIQTMRKGLKNAKNRAKAKGDKQEVERIDTIAKDIDQFRIDLVNAYLEDFFNSNPGYADQVQAVVQGGAAKGNPEYQGIYGDIDFTILTLGDADNAKIKQELEKFFEDRGYPLATKDSNNYSPMDTETFAQPAGRFDSTREARDTVVKDTVIKMADATRFYSEGGGKWFINNMAYSGLKLWGELPDTDQWVRVERHEAHGLAVDMTRFMDFLSDPHYHADAIAGISDPAKQRDTLESVLKKTKYFIRLVDAYLISHPRGNEIYNKDRAKRKKPDGDDASYHWQIYKDAQILVNEGQTTLFKAGDLEVIKWMAEMKMKGRNPTPFAVLGDDTDGVKKGLEMVRRMQEMGADILADTAETHHRETERIIASGTAQERRLLEADLQRKASTVRKVMDTDTFGAMALMIPKASIDNSGKVTVLTQEAHRKLIVDRMRAYRAIRERIVPDDKVDEALASQPTDDPLGQRTRDEVTKLIADALGDQALASALTEGELGNLEEENYMQWFRHTWHMTDKLQQAAPASGATTP